MQLVGQPAAHLLLCRSSERERLAPGATTNSLAYARNMLLITNSSASALFLAPLPNSQILFNDVASFGLGGQVHAV